MTDLRRLKKNIQKMEESERSLHKAKTTDSDKACRRRKTRTKHTQTFVKIVESLQKALGITNENTL